MAEETPQKLSEEIINRILDYCRSKAKNCYGVRWRYKPIGSRCVRATMLLLLESHFSTGLRAEDLLDLRIQDLPEWKDIATDLNFPIKLLPQDISPEVLEKWRAFVCNFNQRAIKGLNKGDYGALRTPIFVEHEDSNVPVELWIICRHLKLIAKNTGVELRPTVLFQSCSFFGQMCKRERPCSAVLKKDKELKFGYWMPTYE